MTTKWKVAFKHAKVFLDIGRIKAEVFHAKGSHGVSIELADSFLTNELMANLLTLGSITVSARSDWKNKLWLSIHVWPDREVK